MASPRLGKPRIYIAAPLFSEAERTYNLKVKEALEQMFEVFLPQEDGLLAADLIRSGWPPQSAFTSVFDADVTAVRDCSHLLIVLDGRAVDEGAAFELGLAYSLSKVCVGLQTDPRRLLPDGNNPMIACALRTIFHSLAELSEWAMATGLPLQCQGGQVVDL